MDIVARGFTNCGGSTCLGLFDNGGIEREKSLESGGKSSKLSKAFKSKLLSGVLNEALGNIFGNAFGTVLSDEPSLSGSDLTNMLSKSDFGLVVELLVNPLGGNLTTGRVETTTSRVGSVFLSGFVEMNAKAV